MSISVEDLGIFSLPSFRRQLRRQGITFSRIEKYLLSGRVVSGTYSFGKNTIDWSILSDGDTLYLVLSYCKILPDRSVSSRVESRFNLVRKESNLKSGTYRYYLSDPEEGGLFEKLYLWSGNFVTRRALSLLGIRYRQQRESHLRRYIWTFYHRVPRWEDMKYRKSHYRGRITPVWRRYEYLTTEGDNRLLSYLYLKGGIDLSFCGLPSLYTEDLGKGDIFI